jgi:hypothetical protein
MLIKEISMKKTLLILFIIAIPTFGFSQQKQFILSKDSVIVKNQVEFYLYNGPYGDKNNIKEPAIKFILTVTNKGNKPIPDVDVSNRSEYVNLYINDSLSNPVSMYNGTEITGDHLIKKNGSDTYIWWIFEKDAYSNIFTVQWKYMELFSEKIKVDVKKKTTVNIK